MLAKFPGKCAATGRDYPAGTPITKGAKGWQIANPAGPVGPVYQLARIMPDGPIKSVPVNRTLFCGNCIKADGKSAEDLSKNLEAAAPYARERRGDDFVCPRCGSTLHLLSRDEIAQECPPETKTCWECGREFTYAECRRNGGDWNENGGYCGC